MSSWRGHLIIGAVGGLALARGLIVTHHLPVVTHVPPEVVAAGVVAASAYLALIPDSDEPGSWIGRRVHAVVTVLCGLLATAIVFVYRLPLLAVAPIVIVGTLIGMALGALLLRAIRHAAGGHRRLTHSLISTLALIVLTIVLVVIRARFWTLIPAALAWGQMLHILGDLPTPAGVPLLYPFSAQRVGLPRVLAMYGEQLALVVAGALGAWLLLSWS